VVQQTLILKYYTMKLNSKIKIASFILLVVTIIISCEKNDLRLTQFDLPADKAYVRFVFLSPNTPSVVIKVNDVKVNGANTSGSAGLFPSITTAADYSATIPNGNLKLSLVNAGTSNDSVVIFTNTLNLTANKFYTTTLADTGVDRTVFSLEDDISYADSGFFRIRMINAMPKSPAINLVRIDSTNATTVVRDTIARNIAFKSSSSFITTSVSPATGYTTLRFRVVNANGTQIGATITPLAVATASKRSFSFFASGFANGTGSLAPFVTTFVYNK
jgi:hypothetical protein